jgi:hypothetical protein
VGKHQEVTVTGLPSTKGGFIGRRSQQEIGPMTASEWQTCHEPQKMLELLSSSGKATDRKLRAFVAACVRRMEPLLNKDDMEQRADPEEWARSVYNALEVVERFIDGRATEQEVWDADFPAFDQSEDKVVYAICTALESCRVTGAEVIDCAVTVARYAKEARQEAAWYANPNRQYHDAWEVLEADAGQAENSVLADLLRDIFGPLPFHPVPIPDAVLAWSEGCVKKLAAGIYDKRDFSQERMGVLADALEEAGLSDEEVLGHLRGAGAHCVGCWCVDLLLAKE